MSSALTLGLLSVERMALKLSDSFDEIIAVVKLGDEDRTKDIINKAAEMLNDKVKLNVPLGAEVQFGNTYADIH